MPLHSPTAIAEIAKLSCLSVADLRAEWVRVLGSSPPKTISREYLVRAIAYHLQCGPHRGVPATVLRALKKLSANATSSVGATEAATRALKPGARILREWKGAVHEVEVVDTGYRYGDQIYKSLSVIARQITGTRWSGPVFFGLKQSRAEISHGV